MGWINTARYKWAEIVGKEIKFRPATFYLAVADMLAGEVEGQPKLEGQEEGPSGNGQSAAGKGAVLADVPGSGTNQGVEGLVGREGEVSGGLSHSGSNQSAENASQSNPTLPTGARGSHEDEDGHDVETRCASVNHSKPPEG